MSGHVQTAGRLTRALSGNGKAVGDQDEEGRDRSLNYVAGALEGSITKGVLVGVISVPWLIKFWLGRGCDFTLWVWCKFRKCSFSTEQKIGDHTDANLPRDSNNIDDSHVPTPCKRQCFMLQRVEADWCSYSWLVRTKRMLWSPSIMNQSRLRSSLTSAMTSGERISSIEALEIWILGKLGS